MSESILTRRIDLEKIRIELEDYGTELVRKDAPELYKNRNGISATTIGDYALFAGGADGYSVYEQVDVYNKSLIKTTATSLSTNTWGGAAATMGTRADDSYALIGGGAWTNDIVDAYDSTLTKTNITELSLARYYLAATQINTAFGNYVLFGGGRTGYSEINNVDTVDVYDMDLTRTTSTTLSKGRGDLAATSIGIYALFAGGTSNDGLTDIVDAFDDDLVMTTPVFLSKPRTDLAATSTSKYAFFGGGGLSYTSVDVYDNSLVHSTPIDFSVGRCFYSAGTLLDYAVFACGYDINYKAIDTLEVYNNDLTKVKAENSCAARVSCSSASTGDYLIVAGGIREPVRTLKADAYTYDGEEEFTLFPGTRYKLNDEPEKISTEMKNIKVKKPVNGYLDYKLCYLGE